MSNDTSAKIEASIGRRVGKLANGKEVIDGLFVMNQLTRVYVKHDLASLTVLEKKIISAALGRGEESLVLSFVDYVNEEGARVQGFGLTISPEYSAQFGFKEDGQLIAPTSESHRVHHARHEAHW